MYAKFLIGALAVFLLFVAVDYVSNLSQNFFTHGLAVGGSVGTDQIAAVNFSFFGKSGAGRSYITQGWGRTPFSYAYKNDWHNGIDIAASYGAAIDSPGEGVVIATGNQDNYCPGRGFGRYVAVDDGVNHLILWYAHLGKIFVSQGDKIKKGTIVGTVGSSGFETGTHLHFSIFDEEGFSMMSRNGCGPDAVGKDLNPLLYLGTIYK